MLEHKTTHIDWHVMEVHLREVPNGSTKSLELAEVYINDTIFCGKVPAVTEYESWYTVQCRNGHGIDAATKIKV